MRRLLNRLPVAALLLTTGAAPQTLATQPTSRLAEPWWRARFQEKQTELHRQPVDLLWIGDSITQNWERRSVDAWRDYAPVWQRFYGDRHAVDLGFKGDSTCHVLWRLRHGELDGIAPRAIVLLVGANNFGHIHTDADQTFSGIQAILDEIHARLPTSRILVIGVLPSIRSPWVSANTARVNMLLRQADIRDRPYTSFIDVSKIFITNGVVDPEKFIDPRLTPPDPPLHPTAQAQLELATMIEPILSQMLGDRMHH